METWFFLVKQQENFYCCLPAVLVIVLINPFFVPKEEFLTHYRINAILMFIVAVILLIAFASIAALVFNIYRLKKAEMNLRESEERYRLLFENLPDILFVHKKDMIIFATPSGARLIGVSSPEELIGRSFFEFLMLPCHRDLEKRIRETENSFDVLPPTEMKVVDINGKATDIEITSIKLPYKGEGMVMSVIRDITASKKLKETLELDNIKTEFFANISHELRTPLNVIFSTVQLSELRMNDIKNLEERTHIEKYTSILKQNCYRMLRLVNNLIDATQIKTGNFDLNIRNHNIINIIEEMTLLVADSVRKRGLTVLFDTDTEEKVIACDAEKIERIILNLLSNAVKFSKPNGSISVNVYDRGAHVEISVKDDGIGIPEDKAGKVFDHFWQADRSFTREREGSGISLSIVKSLVEIHGGSISFKSEHGYGTEFIVKLPAKLLPGGAVIGEEYRTADKKSHVERINLEFSDIYYDFGFNDPV